MCRTGRRREEVNQDVGHGRMEVGQSHPVPLPSICSTTRKVEMEGGQPCHIYLSLHVCVVDRQVEFFFFF